MLAAARERREAEQRARRITYDDSASSWTATAGSSTPAGAAARACEARDQGRDQGDDPRASRRGVPLGRGADDLPQGAAAPTSPRRYGRKRTDGLRRRATCRRGAARRRGPRAARRRAGGGAVSLAAIAEAVGTPTYVYNADVIRARYRALDAALAAVPHRIRYAVKANTNLAVLADAARARRRRGHRLRAASLRARCGRLSGRADRLQRRREDAGGAARGGRRRGVGHINVESREELELLDRIAGEARHDVAVGIRVNPDVTVDTASRTSRPASAASSSACRSTRCVAAARVVARAPARRLDGARDAPRQPARRHRSVPGRGRRGCWSCSTALRARRDRRCRLRRHRRRARHPLRATSAPMDPEQLRRRGRAAARADRAHGRISSRDGSSSGRRACCSRGCLYRKHSGGKEFVIVDAGMNDLVRPSHYQAYHEIVEVRGSGPAGGAGGRRRPVCETGDFLALDRDAARASRRRPARRARRRAPTAS